MLEYLPKPWLEPTVLAIPFFVLMLGLEYWAAAKLEHDEKLDDGRHERSSYYSKDAKASLWMGFVSIFTSLAGKLLFLGAYVALFTYVAPWHLPMTAWYTWVSAFVALDFLFYWEHRIAHRVRLVWATHQAHHSSEYFNFSTALRQKWNNSLSMIMWMPLAALGFPPAVIFAVYSLNLVYQFWIHTERIDKLPRPIEFIMNTPSHHRVHHGSDAEYLDKNYAGHLHHLGPHVRQLPEGAVPPALRPHHARRHLQHLDAADPRVRESRARRRRRRPLPRQARLHLRPAGLGARRAQGTARTGRRRVLTGIPSKPFRCT